METQVKLRVARQYNQKPGTVFMAITEHDPYAEGWDAAEAGQGRTDNPYPPYDSCALVAYSLWDRGFVARVNA